MLYWKNKIQATSQTLAIVLVTTLPAALFAAQDHEPVTRSASLSYEQVFENALSIAPESLASGARADQADQYNRLASSLFPGQPVLEASYIDDGALDAVGLREIEAGLRLNLWRPGERQQSEGLARGLSDLYQTWQDNLELEIAGRVRRAVWALQLADAMLELEREALAAAREFEQLTNAQFAAGSVAERDVLRARALVMSQQQAVYEAEAQLVDAEREYQVITGLNVRPAQTFLEQRSSRTEISISHPLLQFLQANVEVSRSRVDQVRQVNAERPSIRLGMRRERASVFESYIDTLGIGFTMPLGRSPTVAGQVSDARQAQADMQVALQQGRIMLDQQLHEAEHQLYTMEPTLELAISQVELSQQQWEMSRLAYETGEADAVSVVLSLRELIAARKARADAELRYQQLISDYNQSVGLLP